MTSSPQTQSKQTFEERPPEDSQRPDQQSPKHQPSSRWPWVAGIAALILAGGGAAWWFWPRQQQPSQTAQPTDPVAVETVEAERAAAADDRTLTGTVTSENTVTLRSRVRGRILRLPVEAGDRVQPDQLLAEIDVEDIQAQQRQAESGVAQARTAVSVARSARSAAQSQLNQARASRQEALGQLTEAQAQLEQARVDQQRFTYLEAEGAVPQSRLDDVNTQVNTLEARVEQIQSAIAQADSAIGAAQAQVAQSDDEVNRARERVNQAQAQVQQARANLDYGLVRAPFAGVVTQQHSEVGTLAGPGQPVVTLENANQLEFTVSVPESLIVQMQSGQDVPVYIDALDRTVNGTVDQIVPAADPRSHSFTARLDLPSTANLIPGMFGQLQLMPNSPSSRQVVTIPTEAVIERMGLKGVFVASDGEAEFQQITTGQRQDGQVEVFSGLSPGDRVIVEPIAQVRAGMAVTMRP